MRPRRCLRGVGHSGIPRHGGVHHGRRRAAAAGPLHTVAGSTAPGARPRLGRFAGGPAGRADPGRTQPPRPAPPAVEAGRTGSGPRLGGGRPGHRGRPLHHPRPARRRHLGARRGRPHPRPGPARPRGPLRDPRTRQARRDPAAARPASRGGPQPPPSPAHQAQRQTRHQPPLRRRQRLLRDRPRPVHGVLLRLLGQPGQHPRTGPARQARTRLPQARPEPRVSGCSTSAAAGVPWPSTPPASTA
ncbi:hypothetical protein SPURM210S_06217 [Streptomyces purpurascens]